MSRPSGKFPFTLSILAAMASLVSLAPAQNTPEPVSQSDSIKSPYRAIGRLKFLSGSDDYVGTASLIKSDVVLTCAHVLYDPSNGFSTNFRFERARNGDQVFEIGRPASATVMTGYRADSRNFGTASTSSYARDLAVIRFNRKFSGGTVRWRNNIKLMTNSTQKRAYGYSSRTLVMSQTSQPCDKVVPGYYFNFGNLLAEGMSGGPLFVRTSSGLVQIAVNVSGRDPDPINNVRGVSGYRVIDGEAERFIKTQQDRTVE